MARVDASVPFLLSPHTTTSVSNSGARLRRLSTFLVVSCATSSAATTLLLLLYVTTTNPTSTYHSLFLRLGDNATAARHLLALTSRPHVAGTAANSLAADHVASSLSSLSFLTHSVFYSVLLSYPIHRSLTLIPSPSYSAAISFSLTQETYPGDPYAAAAAEAIPTFYAYSATGSAAASAVYANYGRLEDFAYLKSVGIDVAGAVVLARYGKIHCEDIARNARSSGASAAVIYTDPLQYGGLNGGKWFPAARWLPPSGVQVGSLFRGFGDPSTPMWASSEGCERVSVAEAMASDDMPGIPALPVSAQDAMAIHRAIGGPVAPDDWQGADGAPVYRLGPGPAILNLTYIGNDTMATIENVFAVIEGKEEPDRYVILGNHRDAWTFGAVDPNSGTAAMIELAQRFSILQKKGWRPRRTIILCSWDAEEYGLTGSTEWVEENREMLSSRAVAYLNVDVSVIGPGFHASATPQLDELLKEVTKKVQDPDNSSQTVYESWTTSNGSPVVGRLGGGGSDFAAFLQHVGIPSTDMYFGEGPGYPVYHSLYDDFVWMEKFGDPGFHRHVAAASIWGLLALRLADDEMLPFNYVSYALELEECTKVLEGEVLGRPVSLSPLQSSIKDLKNAAIKIDNERKALQRQSWGPQLSKDSLKIRDLNDRLMMAERAFTSREGLFKQEWSKHLIYASSDQNDWESKSFPGVADAVERARSSNTSESWRFVQHEIYRVARAVTQASAVLSGRLT